MNNKVTPIRPTLKVSDKAYQQNREYKKVKQLQLEAIEEFKRQKAEDTEAIICNLIGMASLMAIIFIMANFISQ